MSDLLRGEGKLTSDDYGTRNIYEQKRYEEALAKKAFRKKAFIIIIVASAYYYYTNYGSPF
jgi:hypothetical protein